MNYRPKKHLGQNFLTDTRIQQKIIQSCALGPGDTVLEIGPGQGVLTQLIAPQVKRLVGVETDRDLIEPLQAICPSAEIVHADFLKWDMGNLPRGLKVIGNIPYYISTPIMEKLIEEKDRMADVFLTVQLEFGRRVCAGPGGKDYGSLSCFVQYHADAKMLFKIKNTCFKPSPKVDSCFLHLKMRPHGLKAADEAFMFKLIQAAFQQRRKNIVNTLKTLVPKARLEETLTKLGIGLNARPETLSLTNYIELCNQL